MSQAEDHYNKGGFYAFIFCMVFSFVFFTYISFIHEGVDLKEVPEMSAEGGQTLADAGPKPADMSKVAEPWVEDPAVVAAGAVAYAENCATCHGDTGLGDTPAGKAVKARNLVEGKWVTKGDSIAMYNVLEKGLEGTGMASFNYIDANNRWAIVQFVRSITKNKVADDAAALASFGKTAK